MQFALPDGYNLNVEEVGSGFPLIVLHGGPGLDHSMFRPYLDPLGDEYRLLYVDERGQGRSQRVDPATLSLEAFARDVDLLAETLELDSFALLGHSFGAIIATYHAPSSAPPPPTSSPREATRAPRSTPMSRPRSTRWATPARRSPSRGRTRRPSRRTRSSCSSSATSCRSTSTASRHPATPSKPSRRPRFYVTSPTQATATSTTARS